jgi:two-component system response regulator (stage 0 sporulation protein A)
MENMNWEIHDLIREKGINRTYLGYRYLVYILELAREHPEMLNRVTKLVYPEVARRFQVSTSQVDGALRTAIKVSWNEAPKELYANTEWKESAPTVSQFLRLLAEEDRQRNGKK